MRAKLFSLLVLLAGLAEGTARAACSDGQVRVRGKTPVRRGPGLNYPVSRFLESARCAPLEQVSTQGRWALLRLGDDFGWVPVARLSEQSRARAEAARADAAPIGSGTARAFAMVIERAVLRERPQPGAPPRRILPVDARVLPLRVTQDTAWVEVRDDRGDVGWVERARVAGGLALAELPRLEPEPPSGPAGHLPVLEGSAARLARRRVGARSEGVHLTAALFGAAVLPTQRLDSDGEAGIRRYDLSALSGGLGAELQLTDLGPVTARLGLTLAVLGGIESDGAEGAAGGTTLAVTARAGWPIDLGGVVLSPELGYALDATQIDVALPGARVATFVSTETHLGLLGARAQAPLGDRFLVEADLALALGGTSPSPGSLGSGGGLAWGGRASMGAYLMIDEALGVLARYQLDGFSADFSGTGTLDPTITRATVGELRQAILLGAAYSL